MGLICTEIKTEIKIGFSSFIRSCIFLQQKYTAMTLFSARGLELSETKASI